MKRFNKGVKITIITFISFFVLAYCSAWVYYHKKATETIEVYNYYIEQGERDVGKLYTILEEVDTYIQQNKKLVTIGDYLNFQQNVFDRLRKADELIQNIRWVVQHRYSYDKDDKYYSEDPLPYNYPGWLPKITGLPRIKEWKYGCLEVGFIAGGTAGAGATHDCDEPLIIIQSTTRYVGQDPKYKLDEIGLNLPEELHIIIIEALLLTKNVPEQIFVTGEVDFISHWGTMEGYIRRTYNTDIRNFFAYCEVNPNFAYNGRVSEVSSSPRRVDKPSDYINNQWKKWKKLPKNTEDLENTLAESAAKIMLGDDATEDDIILGRESFKTGAKIVLGNVDPLSEAMHILSVAENPGRYAAKNTTYKTPKTTSRKPSLPYYEGDALKRTLNQRELDTIRNHLLSYAPIREYFAADVDDFLNVLKNYTVHSIVGRQYACEKRRIQYISDCLYNYPIIYTPDIRCDFTDGPTNYEGASACHPDLDRYFDKTYVALRKGLLSKMRKQLKTPINIIR